LGGERGKEAIAEGREEKQEEEAAYSYSPTPLIFRILRGGGKKVKKEKKKRVRYRERRKREREKVRPSPNWRIFLYSQSAQNISPINGRVVRIAGGKKRRGKGPTEGRRKGEKRTSTTPTERSEFHSLTALA